MALVAIRSKPGSSELLQPKMLAVSSLDFSPASERVDMGMRDTSDDSKSQKSTVTTMQFLSHSVKGIPCLRSLKLLWLIT